MKFYPTLLFFLISLASLGQNLIPNGDFEQYWHCPTDGAQIDSAKYWIEPSMGTSEYFNGCSSSSVVNIPNTGWGYQHARSGSAFAGIYLKWWVVDNFREYIEVPLDSTLDPGTCYHFEMYINLANISKLTTDAIGVYFSDSILQGIPNGWPLPFTPQINNIPGNYPDSLNWTIVSGNYTALGGEKYLTIGNFKDDASMDTVIVDLAGYSLSYIYIDDVSLVRCSNVGILNYDNNVTINAFPNPMVDLLTITINNTEPTEIILYDITTRKLLQETFTNKITINNEHLAKGVYFYEVRNKNGIIKKGKVIKQ